MLQPQILIDNVQSRFWTVPNFSPDLYETLRAIPLYHHPPIMVYGKMGEQNRDIGFFSDESIGYRYSNQMIPSTPLGTYPIMRWLLVETNKILGTNFNGVLVNKYIGGEDYIGAHSDEESALDKQRRMVAGIAYGPQIRTFRIRDKKTKEIVLDFEHQPCSLIVMEGSFQSDYTHEIAVQKKRKGERISVTFRHHLD